jgi:neutral ceramidase
MYRMLSTLLAVLFFASPNLSADELHVGGAKVNITPKKGESHYRGVSEGTHDPLFARALVFEQGKVKAALVVLDVLNVSMDLTGPARKLAAAKTGIPEANIAVTATHTHCSPLNHNDLKPDEKDTYAARVRDSIVEALVQAQKGARVATLHVGKPLQTPAISFNRRYHMKDGSVKMNPGFLNLDIVKPEGPIDPEVGILLFKDAKTKKPFASLTSFAMHLDTVGTKFYSADYPYYIHDFFESEFGADFISVFGTGTCGDINHIDVTKPGPQKGHMDGYQTTRYLGGMLNDTIKKHLAKLKPDEPALEVRGQVLMLPLQKVTDKELAWAKDDNAPPLIKERPFLVNFRKKKILSLEKLHQKVWRQAALRGAGVSPGQGHCPDLPARGDLCGAGPGHQEGLAVSSHPGDRVGQQ